VSTVVTRRGVFERCHGSKRTRAGESKMRCRVTEPSDFSARQCERQRVTEYTTVSIPKELADRVDETIEGTSFTSTSDLVRFLLRSIVIQEERSGRLTESEFEDIAEQLADLGYLD
jgi:Arc/MetJ-type ribon-helix-helix transcriptional regulator